MASTPRVCYSFTMRSPLESTTTYAMASTPRVCYFIHNDVTPRVCYFIHNDIITRVCHCINNDAIPKMMSPLQSATPYTMIFHCRSHWSFSPLWTSADTLRNFPVDEALFKCSNELPSNIPNYPYHIRNDMQTMLLKQNEHNTDLFTHALWWPLLELL